MVKKYVYGIQAIPKNIKIMLQKYYGSIFQEPFNNLVKSMIFIMVRKNP